MIIRKFKILLGVFTYILLMATNVSAQETTDDRHVEVSMRMIGHQLLLKYGNDSSRVLPIQKEGNVYRIHFDTEFEFVPEDLAATIDSVVEQTEIATAYIVEVEHTASKLIVYSYEINDSLTGDIVPCRQREQPESYYDILFSILERSDPISEEALSLLEDDGEGVPIEKKGSSSVMWWLLLCVVLAVIIVMLRKKKPQPKLNSDVISLGAYQFDQRNMQLVSATGKIELSGKESDLLILLFDSVNSTVERERILQVVWGDEGDYVGRTLDVFISKLRKKLEGDPNVKILNIRGVGYKLVMNS